MTATTSFTPPALLLLPLLLLLSLSLRASSTAISQKGFIDSLTLLCSTPDCSVSNIHGGAISMMRRMAAMHEAEMQGMRSGDEMVW